MDTSLSKLQEMVKDREVWSAAVCGAAKSGTWLSDQTTAKADRGTDSILHDSSESVSFYARFTEQEIEVEHGWKLPVKAQLKRDEPEIHTQTIWTLCYNIFMYFILFSILFI